MKVKFLSVIFLITAVFYAFGQDGILATFKFKDTDIRMALQAIAQKAVKDGRKVNILISPDIKGLINADLENVDWQTALEAVLKTYNYGYEWTGRNIILVDTLDNLSDKRKKTAESKVAEPLDSKVFALSFAKVEEVRPIIQGMLTGRGKIISDARTNTLVITDTQSNLQVVEDAMKALDAITPQVLIEAKVLETDLELTNKLGISWNVAAGVSGSSRPHIWPFSSVSNNKFLSFGEKFESTQDGSSTGSVTSSTYISKPMVFPAASSGFTYGTLNASTLAATLEAIMTDNNTKILSIPQITTLDNTPAAIEVSTEDPVPQYNYNTQTGSWEIRGYEKIKYGVSLEVLPQINREGFITLVVKPSISEKVGEKTFTSGGSGSSVLMPILDRQATSTKVMIRDGNTLVIGGLVRDKVIATVNKVPLLGDIPLLGYLFKHKSKATVKKNLLIFITPRIVTPDRLSGKESAAPLAQQALEQKSK